MGKGVLMRTSEKNKAYSRKTHLKRKAGDGVITHTMKPNGKTYCGISPRWNTVIAEVFTCGSCEAYLKKRRENGVL